MASLISKVDSEFSKDNNTINELNQQISNNTLNCVCSNSVLFTMLPVNNDKMYNYSNYDKPSNAEFFKFQSVYTGSIRLTTHLSTNSETYTTYVIIKHQRRDGTLVKQYDKIYPTTAYTSYNTDITDVRIGDIISILGTSSGRLYLNGLILRGTLV
jgi:hypothetical protein